MFLADFAMSEKRGVSARYGVVSKTSKQTKPSATML
jgi:hypothetical protein